MLKVGKTHTIEFDTKSYQVNVTIAKRTNIRLKELMINRSQKNRWHGQRVCDATTQTYVKSDH